MNKKHSVAYKAGRKWAKENIKANGIQWTKSILSKSNNSFLEGANKVIAEASEDYIFVTVREEEWLKKSDEIEKKYEVVEKVVHELLDQTFVTVKCVRR